MIIQSKLLNNIPGIQHGFGTFEEPIPELALPLWKESAPSWKQVHGCTFVRVDQARQLCGEVDALYTSKKEIPIGVGTADCVPILLAHLEGRKIAAIHAGWRGTLARIIEKLWSQLEAEGERVSEWGAAIGPSIGPCCYEVSEELSNQFLEEFKELPPDLVSLKKRFLDLSAVNAAILKNLGFSQVDELKLCTFCSAKPRFNSYRRLKDKTAKKNQYSVMLRTA